MEIRKIIKEEIGNFGWVNNVPEVDLLQILELALKDTAFPVFLKKRYTRGEEMLVIQDMYGNSFDTFSIRKIKNGEHTFDSITKEFERNCNMSWDDEQTEREYCEIYSSLLEYKKENLTNLK